ncbi:phosphohydrolase [Lacticaseibacillus brantae DSM 23927]|uniref:Phosphohydrolase n=1 Tax=Lacticaseibacillus brantae DSM 23927 TaxID=1423727 RepID=A0A0R2AUQ9_9LACO|nr:phosphohydrolase [Lacticaseibacillus brantae DSM 23927]
MKIGISVDNHFDVNHEDGQERLKQQAAYLVAHDYQYYLNAGDTYNDFGKTLAYFQSLQRELGSAVTVRFLAGNHDLVNGISYAEAQSDLDLLYFHEKSLAIPGTNAVLVGNNGWYDYSLSELGTSKTDAEYAQWKRAFWIDRGIDQPVSDRERMQRVLTTTEAALNANAGRQVVYITHFVPDRSFLVYGIDRPYWQMATALMGSQALGDLLGRHAVSQVAFGHLHFRDRPRLLNGGVYYHQPLGYGNKRLFEWKSHDWLTEWQNTLVTVNIPAEK